MYSKNSKFEFLHVNEIGIREKAKSATVIIKKALYCSVGNTLKYVTK